MKSWYYFLQAKQPTELETAPVFIVGVGIGKADQKAHAALAAAALVDDTIYYCIKSDESARFYHNLLAQNPYRAIYKVTAALLWSFFRKNSLQNIDVVTRNVENLSLLYRCNHRNLRIGHSVYPFESKFL